MKNAAGILAFGRHVRQLRETRGWSQEVLADEADIAKPTVQRIEKGQAAATLEVLLSLARALQVPFGEFMNAPGIEAQE